MPLIDLRRAVGSPPQTTVRGHLKTLTRLGVIERRRESEFPGAVEYELGGAGRALLEVGETVEAWLAEAPEGPLELGGVGARSAVKAVVDGWSSAILRALAARPLSLTQLNRLISDLNYPSLERRLGALRLAGLIEALPGHSRGTPYVVTEWLRRAVGPISAATRWERSFNVEEAACVGRMDVEAGFLLSLPLVDLPEDTSGSCRLAVQIGGGGDPAHAGVLVGLEDGQVASCVSRLQGQADGWASGSVGAWMRALIGGEVDQLEVGGDCSLVLTTLDGLHGSLFRVRQTA